MAELVKDQIVAVDNMLLNAWGTIYKMAVKYLDYNVHSYELSRTEEMMTAKKLVSDLWSVLEYCCIILCYNYDGVPNPKKARKIHFPCNYTALSSESADLEQWEKEQLEDIAQLPTEEYEEKFQGAFSDVQFKGEATSDVNAFYRLHYLRNTLTHQSVNITGSDENGHQPEILRFHNIQRNAQAAITVNLPIEPWKRNSTTMTSVPLLDVLFQACKVVEDRRDKLLGVIIDMKFRDKFDFKFSEEVLQVTFKQIDKEHSIRCNHEHLIRCNHLDLECYGMEAELKELLQELRSNEYLDPDCENQ